MEITQKQWKEFQEFKDEYLEELRKKNLLLQEIGDTLDGRILSNNIHNDAIETRHMKAKTITADKLNIANVADIGNIILGNTGYIRTIGKDSYASGVAGFWQGYDVDKYKINIGNANYNLRWTGVKLEIKGDMLAGTISGTRFNVGSGTNEDIYFKDSEIRVYDSVSGDYRKIHFKYDMLDFCRVSYYTIDDTPVMALLSNAGASVNLGLQSGDSHAYIYFTGTDVFYIASEVAYMCLEFYSTGQLRLPPLPAAPTSNNLWGEIAFAQTGTGATMMKYYVDKWYHVSGVSGW